MNITVKKKYLKQDLKRDFPHFRSKTATSWLKDMKDTSYLSKCLVQRSKVYFKLTAY